MRLGVALPVVLSVVAIFGTGCLGLVQPDPSVASWTKTDATPYFAQVGHRGMCMGAPEPCHHATVLYEGGEVLWFSYSTTYAPRDPDDAEPESSLVVPGEAYRDTLRDALDHLGQASQAYVVALTTARLTDDDADEIEALLKREQQRADDPGEATYRCTDWGAPRVVFFSAPVWDVRVVADGEECGENVHPQEAWFRIRAQGDALVRWLAPDPWSHAQGVVEPGSSVD